MFLPPPQFCGKRVAPLPFHFTLNSSLKTTDRFRLVSEASLFVKVDQCNKIFFPFYIFDDLMLPYAEWTALLGRGLTCFLVMTKRAFCLRVYADGLMMGVFILSVFLASEWNVIFPTITIPTLSLTPPIESWIRRTDITRLTWEMPGMQKRHFFQKFGISVCCLGASTCQDGKPKIRVRSHPILNLHSTKWLKITPATL